MAENESGRAAVGDRETPRKKDVWDIVSTLTIPVVTLVLGLLGTYVTWSFNQRQSADHVAEVAKQSTDHNAEIAADVRQKQFLSEADRGEREAAAKRQLAQQAFDAEKDRLQREQQSRDSAKIAEAEQLQKLYDYVSSEDPKKRAFGYAMFESLGAPEIAVKIIKLTEDKAGIPVLQSVRQSGNATLSAAADQALAAFENTTGSLHDRSSCRRFVEAGFTAHRSPPDRGDYVELAKEHGVEPEALMAFISVETSGQDGVLADGRPKILFERTLFHRLTGGKFDDVNPGISNSVMGGFGAPGAHQYDRLLAAAKLDCDSALQATSWGIFQILGSNYKRAGYEHPDDFISDIIQDSGKELRAGIEFMNRSGILDALRQKDWGQVARLTNGANYALNRYDQHLKAEYERAKRDSAVK